MEYKNDTSLITILDDPDPARQCDENHLDGVDHVTEDRHNEKDEDQLDHLPTQIRKKNKKI